MVINSVNVVDGGRQQYKKLKMKSSMNLEELNQNSSEKLSQRKKSSGGSHTNKTQEAIHANETHQTFTPINKISETDLDRYLDSDTRLQAANFPLHDIHSLHGGSGLQNTSISKQFEIRDEQQLLKQREIVERMQDKITLIEQTNRKLRHSLNMTLMHSELNSPL